MFLIVKAKCHCHMDWPRSQDEILGVAPLESLQRFRFLVNHYSVSGDIGPAQSLLSKRAPSVVAPSPSTPLAPQPLQINLLLYTAYCLHPLLCFPIYFLSNERYRNYYPRTITADASCETNHDSVILHGSVICDYAGPPSCNQHGLTHSITSWAKMIQYSSL